MIFSFLMDFLFSNYLSINTFFIICDIGNKKVTDILLVGFIYDLLFGKFLLFTFILFIFYLLYRFIKINGKYYYIKNIVFYIMFYFICINKYFNILLFIISVFLYIFYLYIDRKLLN